MLIFIVPTKRFSNRTKAWLTKGAVFAVALVFWGVTNTGAILGTLGFTYTRAEAKPEISAAGQTVIEPEESESAVTYPYDSMVLPSEESLLYYDPDGDLLPNGDSRFYYSISYMLHNPGQTVRLLVHTLTTEAGKYRHEKDIITFFKIWIQALDRYVRINGKTRFHSSLPDLVKHLSRILCRVDMETEHMNSDLSKSLDIILRLHDHKVRIKSLGRLTCDSLDYRETI
jgi:hypothetical protein